MALTCNMMGIAQYIAVRSFSENMVPKKAKTGRQTLAHKYKIQKRTKEHHR